MKSWLKKYGHGLIVFYYVLCTIMYYFTVFNREPVIIIHSTIVDDLIPFCEVFIIPYVIWYIYLFGSFFVFFIKSKEHFIRFCIYTFVGMTVAYLIFLILPNGIDFRPDLASFGRDNIFMRMVNVIYTIDENPYSVCPSLHCYNAIVISVALTKSRIFDNKKWITIGSWILTFLICLSTMFIKQHSVIDFFFAIVLAAIIYPIAYKVKWKFIKEENS